MLRPSVQDHLSAVCLLSPGFLSQSLQVFLGWLDKVSAGQLMENESKLRFRTDPDEPFPHRVLRVCLPLAPSQLCACVHVPPHKHATAMFMVTWLRPHKHGHSCGRTDATSDLLVGLLEMNGSERRGEQQFQPEVQRSTSLICLQHKSQLCHFGIKVPNLEEFW